MWVRVPPRALALTTRHANEVTAFVHALPAICGALVDQWLGEPPARWHPVVHFGAAMRWVEHRLYADRRRNGVAFAAVGVGLGVAAGLGLRRAVGPVPATAIATALCAAGKMLDREAMAVRELVVCGDLPAARARLRSLVGRTTDDLDEAEISRATIESVAENCVDAVTSSLFWATLGGAPAVLAHRAINTLDAMVGHLDDRYERFGWASARLDDVMGFVPARLTAAAVAAVTPSRARSILRTLRRDAPRHPSPNAGVVEAAFAAALGVRLGGVNRYGSSVQDRGTLGDGPPPTAATIPAAVTLRRRSTAVVAALLAGAAALHQLTRRRPRWAQGAGGLRVGRWAAQVS